MTEPSQSDFKLQPLRIPHGWYVTYNGFTEADPIEGHGDYHALYFRQDLLQLKHHSTNRLIDLGWYPDGDLTNGYFCIVVHEGDFRGPLLHQFESRSRFVIAAELERLMVEIGYCRL